MRTDPTPPWWPRLLCAESCCGFFQLIISVSSSSLLVAGKTWYWPPSPCCDEIPKLLRLVPEKVCFRLDFQRFLLMVTMSSLLALGTYVAKEACSLYSARKQRQKGNKNPNTPYKDNIPQYSPNNQTSFWWSYLPLKGSLPQEKYRQAGDHAFNI